MDPTSLKAWRKAERERLIAARLAITPPELDSWRQRIDGYLERSFPGLARCRLAFCWPIKGEYDARHLARTLRARGALTALPVVIAPRTALIFREWHPGITLTKANAVSAGGEFIVGNGDFPGGSNRAFLVRYEDGNQKKNRKPIAGLTTAGALQGSINGLAETRQLALIEQQAFAAPLIEPLHN